MMGHVYTNASCNISATVSIDPQGGLFRQRKSEDIQPGLFKTQTDSTEKWYFMCDSAYWDRHVSNTPLHRRGWVFQARLLSPRVLHFTEKQIFWECFTDQKCEVYPLGIPQNRSLKTFGPLFEPEPPPHRENVAFEIWNELIQAYSECTLTRPSDKLVALSGMADLFQEVTGDEYLAGLWKSRLTQSLGWCIHPPTIKVAPGRRAPSWSWAAVDGQVRPAHLVMGELPLTTIIDTCVFSNFDNSCEAYGGWINVRGPLVQATIHNKAEWDGSLKIGSQQIAASLSEDAAGVLKVGNQVHCLALKCHSKSETEPVNPYSGLIGLLLKIPLSE
jgi:hypothetical protein